MKYVLTTESGSYYNIDLESETWSRNGERTQDLYQYTLHDDYWRDRLYSDEPAEPGTTNLDLAAGKFLHIESFGVPRPGRAYESTMIVQVIKTL